MCIPRDVDGRLPLTAIHPGTADLMATKYLLMQPHEAQSLWRCGACNETFTDDESLQLELRVSQLVHRMIQSLASDTNPSYTDIMTHTKAVVSAVGLCHWATVALLDVSNRCRLEDLDLPLVDRQAEATNTEHAAHLRASAEIVWNFCVHSRGECTPSLFVYSFGLWFLEAAMVSDEETTLLTRSLAAAGDVFQPQTQELLHRLRVGNGTPEEAGSFLASAGQAAAASGRLGEALLFYSAAASHSTAGSICEDLANLRLRIESKENTVGRGVPCG